MTGADFLLDSIIRLTGFNVDDAKKTILELGEKFYQQDQILRQLLEQQTTILARQEQILERLNAEKESENERHHANGKQRGKRDVIANG